MTKPARDRWLRRLLARCWRYRRRMILALAGSLTATIATAAIPLIQRNVVDNAILASREPIWPGATLLLAAAALSFLGVFTRRFQGGRLALDVQHDMRTEMLASIAALDGARQDQLNSGQLVSRAISDLNMVFSLLSMSPMLLGNALLFVLSVAVMAFLSPVLTLIALAIGPALWVISVRSRRKLFPASWDAQQQAAAVAGVVEGAVTGVRVVKGFGQEDQETGRLERASNSLFASRLRTVRLSARYGPALQAVPAIGQVGVLALGGWLAIRGQLTIGTFFAFSAYLAQMVNPVRALTSLVTVGQEVRASVIRVHEVIDARPVIAQRPDAVLLPPGTPDIELDNVDFGYRASQPVLRGLSLRVPAGQTVALVGASGSGKSTIVQLLPRFYDVTGGAVRVGSHDVRDLTLDSLRAAIGLVPEEGFLFSDTIRANIAFGRPDATDDQVIAAARAAQAEEFITGLPAGYETVIGEQGLTLSGGQRQRIALARALITDPAILVLDDALSAIDPRMEAQLHETLQAVTAGRTTLIIAHRLSTVQLADQIAVLDRGTLADLGTHEELRDRCALYREIFGLASDDDRQAGARTHQDTGPLYSGAGSARGNGERPPAEAAAPSAPRATGLAAAAAVAGAAAPPAPAVSGAAIRRGSAARATAISGMLDNVPPSPALLAQVAALPPAADQPEVSQAWARAAEPRFTLRKLLRPFAIGLLIGLVLDGLDAGASIAMPALIGGGIDHGVEAHSAGLVGLLAAIALAIVLADWVVNGRQTTVVGRNSERLLYTLRVKIFSHLQRLGLDFYEREQAGRIMTRMTTDIDALSMFFQTGLVTMINSVLTFAGVLIAMLVINMRLGLTLSALIPLLVIVTVLFRSASAKAYAEARERVAVVNADFQENVAGLRVVQAYRRERRNQRRFSELSRQYLRVRMRAQVLIALYFPFVQALAVVGGALVLFVAAGQVHSRALSAGELIAYLLYIDLLFSPVQQMSQVFDSYQQAAVGLRRIGSLLRTPTSTPADGDRPAARLDGRIEFSGVSFRYAGQDRDAVSDINLAVRPGETVALVGQTGAGKSTVVKLIARFYDVTGGRLTVDGIDVRDYDLGSYRRRLGVVPQEPYLFAGTVSEAIGYGRPDASQADIEAAARAVGAYDVIAALPGGFGHEVTERGRNLAAGQRQLIALARAYLVDPDILLLDEATAALDLAAEAAVIRATEQLTARRTTILVAHRLTTAARADRIAVLDGGRITETGTHDELLAAGGGYAELWGAFSGQAALVG